LRRRKFITLLGGAAAWPHAAGAQQGERVRRIGVLMNLSSDDREGQARVAAFRDGLQQSGWIEGRNARLDIRWAAGESDRFRMFAKELVALAPDIILAASGTAMPPLLQATRTIPIVFVQVADLACSSGSSNPAIPQRTRTVPVGDDWQHEIKFDGFRVQIHKLGNEVQLYFGSGSRFGRRRPLLCKVLRELPVIGEVVASEFGTKCA